VPDFAAWCTTTGHALIERSETDGVFRFLIQKTR
jgi:TusA-related sulfurtransferase